MGQTFKILTFNVHRGKSSFRRRDICERVAQIMDFSSAQAICLQEVWQHEGFDQHVLEQHLCDQRWPHRVFAKTVGFKRGVQGNAVVSQAPVREWSYFDISIPKREPRGMLHAVIEPGVSVFNVHLGLARRERKSQIALLRDFVRDRVDPEAPLFIAGDFNDWRREVSGFLEEDLGTREVMVEARGRHGNTFPSYLPFLPLDRIYYRNCRLIRARIVRDRRALALSDHLPVEAEFEL